MPDWAVGDPGLLSGVMGAEAVGRAQAFGVRMRYDQLAKPSPTTTAKNGSSRESGESRPDFEEVVDVAVAIGHALDDLDAVLMPSSLPVCMGQRTRDWTPRQ